MLRKEVWKWKKPWKVVLETAQNGVAFLSCCPSTTPCSFRRTPHNAYETGKRAIRIGSSAPEYQQLASSQYLRGLVLIWAINSFDQGTF